MVIFVDHLHMFKGNEVVFIDHRKFELLIFAGLYPLMVPPFYHDRYVVVERLPEWLAWSFWIGALITVPDGGLLLLLGLNDRRIVFWTLGVAGLVS